MSSTTPCDSHADHIKKPLSICAVLKKAFSLIKGTKAAIWVPFLTACIIFFFASFIVTITQGAPMDDGALNLARDVLLPLLQLVLMLSIFPGLLAVALKRVRGDSVSMKTGFQYWHKMFSMLLIFVLFFIVCFIVGFISGLILEIVSLLGVDISSFFLNLAAGAGFTFNPAAIIFLLLVFILMAAIYAPLLLAFFALVDGRPLWQSIKCGVCLAKKHVVKVILTLLIIMIIPCIIISLPIFLVMITQGSEILSTLSLLFLVVISLVFSIYYMPFSYLSFAALYDALAPLKTSD